MIWFAAALPPDGWLECNGQSTASYPVLAAIVGATVPDLRGEFIRGWAHDRIGTTDDGRLFGSWQSDQLKSHNHPRNSSGYTESIQAHASITNKSWMGQLTGGSSLLYETTTGLTGGTETRGRNIALLPCIKF